MFEIEIFCDKSVNDTERAMILKAAQLTAPIYGCRFSFDAGGSWASADIQGIFTSCDDIMKEAPTDSEGRKNASRILDMLSEAVKARDKNGAMIIFTAEDLFLGDTWCFGAARVGGRASVQSMRRFRELSDEDKQAVITRTLRHEVGHIHKCAADPKRRNTRKKYGMHCTTQGCTMRQSPNLKDLLKHAKEEDPKDPLCKYCREDLERFKSIYYK